VPVVGRATAPLACGWARHTDALEFAAGQRVVVTAREGAAASSGVLPIPAKEFVGEPAGTWLSRRSYQAHSARRRLQLPGVCSGTHAPEQC
jgi:hypothetical protein